MLTPRVTEIPSARRTHDQEVNHPMPAADQPPMKLHIQTARTSAASARRHQALAGDALNRAREQMRELAARADTTAAHIRTPTRAGRLR